MLIGLTGYAQHGKDTAGLVLTKRHGFKRFALADALKRMAYILNPIVGFDGANESNVRLAQAVDSLGWETAKMGPEVRRLLQVLGTEAGRDVIGANVWVEALAKSIVDAGSPENVVVTDVRFPNEAAWIWAQGGFIVGVQRRDDNGDPYDNGIGTEHPSEQYVADLLHTADAILINMGDDSFLAEADTLPRFLEVLPTLRAARDVPREAENMSPRFDFHVTGEAVVTCGKCGAVKDEHGHLCETDADGSVSRAMMQRYHGGQR